MFSGYIESNSIVMKKKVINLVLSGVLCFLPVTAFSETGGFSQEITFQMPPAQQLPQNRLQEALRNVPVVSYAAPANRDRTRRLTIDDPKAYVFAYYNLPYAINLGGRTDEMTGMIIEQVIVKFNSVQLSAQDEKQILYNAILKLKNLLSMQNTTARQAKYYDETNRSTSQISQASSNGRAVIALREAFCTEDLINKLVFRFNSI